MAATPTADDIFLHARTLPGEQQQSYLQQACGTDETKKHTVERMLEAEAAADSARFLSGLDQDRHAIENNPPTSIASYQILRELGRGAQATVYLAYDSVLDRHVALKVLRSVGLSDAATMTKRFRREATAVANLDHPGLCTIYDTGVADGAAWIAMRYVTGHSLAQLLEQSSASGDALTLPTALDTQTAEQPTTQNAPAATKAPARTQLMRTVALFEKAARALHAAHEHGLVHRDVKPGNLMVSDTGEPVLLDFGIAHACDAEEGGALTRTTDVLGTPAYMSPEQLLAGLATVDRRSDVYSLGVTLYECLTGRRPFDAVSREALHHQILNDEPQPLRQLLSSASRDLEVVVATAMAKEPGRRYASALLLGEDLRRILDTRPILARPITTAARLLRWARRRPAVAASLLVAFVAMAVAIVISNTSLNQVHTAIADKNRSLYALYEPRSRERALADTYHHEGIAEGVVRDLAYSVLDGEVPGFRARLAEFERRLDEAQNGSEDFRNKLELARSSLPHLSELGRLCLADLALEWSRASLLYAAFDPVEQDAIGVELAQIALQGHAMLPPDDLRLFRSRTVCVDALLQAGRSREARALLQQWLLTIEQDDEAIQKAVCKTRLAAILVHSSDEQDVETARQLLNENVPSVLAALPTTLFASGAQSAKVELHDRLGEVAQAEVARRLLGKAIAGLNKPATRRDWDVWSATWRDLYQFLDQQFLKSTDSGLNLEECEQMIARSQEEIQRLKLDDEDPRLTFIADSMLWIGSTLGDKGWGAGHRRPETRLVLEFGLSLYSRNPTANRNSRAEILGRIALHYRMLHDLSQARRLAEQAVAAAEPRSGSWRGMGGVLGECLMDQGEFEAAEPLQIGAFESNLIRNGPMHPITMSRVWNLQLHYLHRDKVDDMLSWFQEKVTTRGVELEPIKLAHAFSSVGQTKAAERLLGGLQPDGEQPFGVQKLRAELALQSGQPDLALRIADQGVAAGFKVLEWLRGRGLYARGNDGDLSLAIDAFANAASRNAWAGWLNSWDHWIEYGKALAAIGRQEDAVAIMQQLTKDFPFDPRAWHARALVLATGQGLQAYRQEAVGHAQTAVSLPTGKQRARFHAGLAEALFQSGEQQKARDMVQELRVAMAGKNRIWLTVEAVQAQADRYGIK